MPSPSPLRGGSLPLPKGKGLSADRRSAAGGCGCGPILPRQGEVAPKATEGEDGHALEAQPSREILTLALGRRNGTVG